MSDLDLDRTFLTADTHFGHRLMAYQRGFGSTREHDEELVERWNGTVPTGATVYHLGDVGFRCSARYLSETLGTLHGRLVLVKGNHDLKGPALRPTCRDAWSEVHDVLMVRGRCDHPVVRSGHPLKVWCSHYAHLSYPRCAAHAFGHSHGRRRYEDGTAVRWSLDVGVDCHDLRPVSLRRFLDLVSSH